MTVVFETTEVRVLRAAMETALHCYRDYQTRLMSLPGGELSAAEWNQETVLLEQLVARLPL